MQGKKIKIPESSENTDVQYLCGKCKQLLKYEPKSFDDGSIGCDNCFAWFYFTCGNIKES